MVMGAFKKIKTQENEAYISVNSIKNTDNNYGIDIMSKFAVEKTGVTVFLSVDNMASLRDCLNIIIENDKENQGE